MALILPSGTNRQTMYLIHQTNIKNNAAMNGLTIKAITQVMPTF